MLIRPLNFTQLRTITRTSISRKICFVKSGFQILHALEQFSSLFSNDKLKGHTYTKPMIRLPCACRGRTAVRFPANRFHMCCEKLALDRLLCTHLSSKGFLRRMTVRMREVLTRPWVGICVLLALRLHQSQCSRVKFNIFFINYCIS